MKRYLALAAGCLIAGAAGAVDNEVTVAFRADAAPFSSRGEDGYEGFMAELCEEAVPRAGYSIGRRVEVMAGNRPLAADSGSGVDLVCDPTTVTVERAARVDFSPILFIANSTYLQKPRPHYLTEDEIARSDDCARAHAADPARNLVGVGMVAHTTAGAVFDLAGATGRVGDTLDYALCRFEFASHAEGVAEVCGGFLTYYFGDLDIMLAEVKGRETCAASRSTDFRAYEPYAIAIPSTDDTFRRAMVSALYGLFADGTALEIYRRAFGTDELKEPLRTLFSVNSVPRGQPPAE